MVDIKKEEINKIVRDSICMLYETSYGRVKQHIEGGESFVMITSDRHERSPEENNSMYRELKQSYKSAGFPFTEIKGGFKETTKYVTDPETGEETQVKLEEPRFVTENTILVTSHPRGDVPREEGNAGQQLFDLTVELASKYQQEAFIFGESATSASGEVFKRIRAYDSVGAAIEEDWAGPWSEAVHVEKDEDFWSRVKGKHFQLKHEQKTKTPQPKSWMEAFKKSRSGMTW